MSDTPSPIPADHDLLAAFAAGDQEAFARLVSRHQALVAAACRRQADATDIDDCVQAVFLILARKAQAAVRVPSLAAWLLRVSTYVCRHSRRAAQRRTRAERAVGSTEGHQPETAVLEHLDHCIDRLNDRQRNAVVLHYYQGLDASEIAGRLGVTRDQVYVLLHRGLAGLRTALARRGVAIGATTLAAIIAGQAQAAGTSLLGVTVVLGRSATPRSQMLAAAAQQAMTVAKLVPWAVAAGLAIVVGSVAAVAADRAPATTPSSSHASAATRTAPTTIQATTTVRAMIRVAPSTSARLVAALDPGSPVDVVGPAPQAPDWTAIRFPRQGRAWMPVADMAPTADPGRWRVVGVDAAAYDEATRSGTIIARFAPGDVLEGKGPQLAGWIPVHPAQALAYIRTDSLRMAGAAPTQAARPSTPVLPTAAERAAIPALAHPLRIFVRGGDGIRTLSTIARAGSLRLRVLGDWRPVDLGDQPAAGKAPEAKPVAAWLDAIATTTGTSWRIVDGVIEIGTGAERASIGPPAEADPLITLSIQDMASKNAFDFLKNLQQVRIATITGRVGPVTMAATEAPTSVVLADLALQLGAYAVETPEGWTITPLAGVAQ